MRMIRGKLRSIDLFGLFFSSMATSHGLTQTSCSNIDTFGSTQQTHVELMMLRSYSLLNGIVADTIFEISILETCVNMYKVKRSQFLMDMYIMP